MKSIDIKKLINGFPTIKKVVYHSFLTILLGVTISVCSSVKEEKSDDSTAVASSGVDITDGSDQGYMRIGNMQIVWASFTKTNGTDHSVTFPKAFLSEPTVSLADTHDSGDNSDFFIVTNSLSKSGFSAGSVGSGTSTGHFIAIGKWQ